MKWKILAALVVAFGLPGCDKQPSIDAGQSSGEPSINRESNAVQVARGKAVYEANCMVCHGADGKGQPGDWRVRDADGYFPPPPLDDSAHAWHHPTSVLLEVIRDGSPQGQGRMPAWKGKLTEQEMQDVVAYIKSLWSDEVYGLWWKMEQQSLER